MNNITYLCIWFHPDKMVNQTATRCHIFAQNVPFLESYELRLLQQQHKTEQKTKCMNGTASALTFQNYHIAN